MLLTNIMKIYTFFLHINLLISLFTERVNTSVSVRDRQRDKERIHNGRLLYWPFLGPRCVSFFRALRPCFFVDRFFAGIRWADVPYDPDGAKRSFWSDFIVAPNDWSWLWLTLIFEWTSVNNFMTPMRSSGSWFTWFAYTHASHVFR